KEGLTAGNFELERTRTRDPGERPRSNAVSIEAGFVPSHEPEDDYVEEVDEPEEEEDEISGEESGTESEDRSEGEAEFRPARPEGDEQNGKRRRRRGGRGRNRDKERGPRPEGAPAPRPPAAEADAQGEPPAAAHFENDSAPLVAQPG